MPDRKTVLAIASRQDSPICRIGSICAIEVLGADENDWISIQPQDDDVQYVFKGSGVHGLKIGPTRIKVLRTKGDKPLTIYAIERHAETTA